MVWLQATCHNFNMTEPTRSPAFSIAVYCGSRAGSTPDFMHLARQVGQWIGQRGGQLVYGGGNNGLMGEVAQATLESGGTVVGVIPESLVEREFANRDCTELHVVQSMHQRKHMMAERAGAFLALPGGIGTFEELFEVWSWRQLGYHDKPIGVLNHKGYYDAMQGFLEQSVSAGFMGPWQMDLVRFESDLEVMLPALVSASQQSAPGDWHQI